MRNTLILLLLSLTVLLGVSCNDRSFADPEWTAVRDSLSDDAKQIQKESFDLSHHYGVGYSFVVRTDTMKLLPILPINIRQYSGDTLLVDRNDELLVAEIQIIPTGQDNDSVWVKVVRNASEVGWTQEGYLLRNVMPGDPISRAIMFFSEVHISVSGYLIAAFILIILMRVISYRRHCRRHPGRHSFLRYMPLPHANDICSPYPLLLYLTLAGSAVFYASMQLYAFETWQHFYFHPTLNPFQVPPLLSAFLVSLWLMLVFFLASLMDMVRQLYFVRMCIYFISMLALMGALYVFFSVSTMYKIGYIIYPVYFVTSIWYYIRFTRPRYRCGHCGTPLHNLGQCPRCRYINDASETPAP